jgi:hypothetical protein
MNRRCVLFVLLTLGLASPALAILGLGDIVFDPQNFEEACKLSRNFSCRTASWFRPIRRSVASTR